MSSKFLNLNNVEKRQRHYTTLSFDDKTSSEEDEKVKLKEAAEDFDMNYRENGIHEEIAEDIKGFFDNSDDSDSIDCNPINTYSDNASLFTRNIKEGTGARPWRGLIRLAIASAPIFLAGYVLVKCVRRIVE